MWLDTTEGKSCRQTVRSILNRETRWKRGYMEKIKIEQHSFTGSLWVVGWLFSIGLLHLPFWRGVLAIVLWPYYLGAMLNSHLH